MAVAAIVVPAVIMAAIVRSLLCLAMYTGCSSLHRHVRRCARRCCHVVTVGAASPTPPYKLAYKAPPKLKVHCPALTKFV